MTDPTWKGHNKGEDDDRRAAKLAKLDHVQRQVTSGRSHGVQGIGQAEWRCVACDTVSRGPISMAGTDVLDCPTCGIKTEHERHRT